MTGRGIGATPGTWRSRERVRGVITQVIEVAYPPRCAGCGLRGCWVCADCLAAVPLFADPRCQTCSMPLHGIACDCRELPLGIDRLWVAGPYDGWLRGAVHDFKFKGETARASSLAALLADAARSLGTDSALVPVPMHAKRKRQRGYDQVAVLATALGNLTGQPVIEALTKDRETLTQVGLSASERSLNLIDAFSLRVAVGLLPDQVVLVDDVATTGSTLSESARALRSAGVSQVSAVVIAHGL